MKQNTLMQKIMKQICFLSKLGSNFFFLGLKGPSSMFCLKIIVYTQYSFIFLLCYVLKGLHISFKNLNAIDFYFLNIILSITRFQISYRKFKIKFFETQISFRKFKIEFFKNIVVLQKF